MKITQQKRVLTLDINEHDSIHYYERFSTGSKILARCNGTVLGNSFRYDGLNLKKYGRGKLKNESAFYRQVEKADTFLKAQGYTFSQL